MMCQKTSRGSVSNGEGWVTFFLLGIADVDFGRVGAEGRGEESRRGVIEKWLNKVNE